MRRLAAVALALLMGVLALPAQAGPTPAQAAGREPADGSQN